ncbi:MAG: hypothetical protein FWC77_01325 [Defluviitaleaceae bacterium]|nr:hypothetical protein [Defluviitaleaceae bacterium]
MEEITMKNTKAEMLEALNAALARAEAAEKSRLNPVKAEKERAEKRAIESAKSSVEQNIFSAELCNKFKDLQIAIAAEEVRLQELYGVSPELQQLALIIEAGRERQSQIDTENNVKVEEAKSFLENLRAEYTQKKAELQEEYDAQAKKLKLDRTREAEEHQYNLKRVRDKENNTWEDEKAARETALQKVENAATDILALAEAKAEYIKSMEEKVDGIPALIESEKAAAVKAAITELTREHEYKTALTSKDYQNNLARNEDRVAYLEKELDVLNKANTALQNKLDKAYAELRELATKTVESASGVKIIGSAGDSQQRN